MHPTINREISRLRIDDLVADAQRVRSVRLARRPRPAARARGRLLVAAAARAAFRHA